MGAPTPDGASRPVERHAVAGREFRGPAAYPCGMSTFRNPVGPQSSNVYWRRRVIVGLAALAVIVIIILIFIQPRGAEPDPTTSDVEDSSEPSTPPADPGAACAPASIKLEAVTDKLSYAAGENPMISLTITNTGSSACTINAGSTVQELIITSGSERYWDSKDCQSDAVDAPVILEPNVPQSSSPIAWDRTRSSASTCDSDRPKVPAGGASYHLSVKVGDIESESTKQFQLN